MFRRMALLLLSAALLLCMAACGEKAEETLPPDSAMPTTAEQIIQFYNDAIGRAVDSRMSFAKRYQSDDDKFNLSPALDSFDSRFQEYTGVKQSMEDRIVTPQSVQADEYESYLRRSTLTEKDVRLAECTLLKGGLYRIKLHLQSGESHIRPGRDEYKSSLDKCGIFAGEPMDIRFDHKTAQNIYEKVRDLFPDVRIDEEQTNIVVIAVFRRDGTPVQLNIRFETKYDIKGIYEIGCSAKGKTIIRYVQFGAETPAFAE